MTRTSMLPACLLVLGCATGQAERTTPTAPTQERVVFDHDLTRGAPADSQVTGGVWREGWSITEERGQRLLLDPGAAISNGYLEVSYVVDAMPDPKGKCNWIGIYENPALHQNQPGDILYIRAEVNRQLKVKAFARRESVHDLRWEERYSHLDELEVDGATVQTVRLTWSGGDAWVKPSIGKPLACADGRRRGEPPLQGCDKGVDSLRYVVLGSDNYMEGTSLKGIRFTRVKLVAVNPL